MAVKNTQARRITPARRIKATDGITALLALEDYAPQRAEYKKAAAQALNDAMIAAQKAEVLAQNALDAARDAAAKAEWDVHNFMIVAAEQVAGQYGSNSDAYASIGYKKKSEYKKAKPKPPKA